MGRFGQQATGRRVNDRMWLRPRRHKAVVRSEIIPCTHPGLNVKRDASWRKLMLQTHSPTSRGWTVATFVATFLLSLLTGAAFGQLSTCDHLADPGFWPTQDPGTRKNYVGPATCAKCHASVAATQATTPMARTFAIRLNAWRRADAGAANRTFG